MRSLDSPQSAVQGFILGFLLWTNKVCGTAKAYTITSISSHLANVNGDVLRFEGSGLVSPIYCTFHYTVKRGPAMERVEGVVSANGMSMVCAVPRTPYRIVLHHQHRLPWPGCSWDDRCMANSFSLTVEAQHSVLRHFNMSYFYGSFKDPHPGYSATSADFQNQLFAMNHPTDCSVVKVLLLRNPQHQGQCTGIGMVFYGHYITALKEAYEQGRALVFKDSFSSYCYYSDRNTDGERYIQLPSNCTPENINMSLVTEFKADKAWFSSVAKSPKYQEQSVSWFRANFLKYLFRYTPSFQQHLLHVTNSMKFQTPCVGVHLRRGERGNMGFTTVWLAEYPLFDLDDAARLLRELKRLTGVGTVVLATDEPEFFNDIPKFSNEFHIIYDKVYKRAEHGRDCVRETIAGCTPGVNASSVIKTILTEIYLLSQCQYYVGTLTSTFSKLAVDYMIANQNQTIVISLE